MNASDVVVVVDINLYYWMPILNIILVIYNIYIYIYIKIYKDIYSLVQYIKFVIISSDHWSMYWGMITKNITKKK